MCLFISNILRFKVSDSKAIHRLLDKHFYTFGVLTKIRIMGKMGKMQYQKWLLAPGLSTIFNLDL